MKTNKNKKGFTLVELVIVIAVIAILAAVLIPTFITVIGNANKSAAEQEGGNVKTEILAIYQGQFDKYCEDYYGAKGEDNVEQKPTSKAVVLTNKGEAALLAGDTMKKFADVEADIPTFGEFAANINSVIVIYYDSANSANNKIEYQTESGYVVTITATGVSAAKGKLVVPES